MFVVQSWFQVGNEFLNTKNGLRKNFPINNKNYLLIIIVNSQKNLQK
jgi:hypothetical protein